MRAKRTLLNTKPSDSSAANKDVVKMPAPNIGAGGDDPINPHSRDVNKTEKRINKISDKCPLVNDTLPEPDSSVKLSGDAGDTYNTNNNDGSSDSQKTLPDTQPVDSDDTVTSSFDNQNDDYWACMLPRNKHFIQVAVKKNTFKCGRDLSSGNDYELIEPNIPRDCIEQYSRTHFILEKIKCGGVSTFNAHIDGINCVNDKSNMHDDDDGDFDVYLTDCSQNGTFVNGELVGKWKKRPLVNNDIISMTAPNREAFRFVLVDNARCKSGSYSGSSDGTMNFGDGFGHIGNGIANGIDGVGPAKQYPEQLTNKYIVGRLLGTGSCGSVHLGYSKPKSSDPNQEYTKVAIKIIKKTSLGYKYYNLNANDIPTDRKRTITEEESEENLRVEVEIMENLSKTTGHPCIVRMEDVFDLPHVLIIVLELAEGGELFKYVLSDFNEESFSEKVAKLQFYQILSGIEYLHAHNVCHRDIKLENILMADKSKTSLIKITDFGLSKLLDEKTLMVSYVGTPSYIAPEVLKNGMCVAATSEGPLEEPMQGLKSGYVASRGFETYTVKADIWSLGCILYSLLCGSSAFDNHDQTKMRKNILNGHFTMDPRCSKVWNVVTEAAKDLVSKLLTVDPRARLSATEALKHEWFINDPEIVQKAISLMNEGRNRTTHRMGSISQGVNNLYVSGKQQTVPRMFDKKENRHAPDAQKGQMAPPTSMVVRKRAADSAAESMDMEEEFFSPGTQTAAISLLDLRPRKKNKGNAQPKQN